MNKIYFYKLTHDSGAAPCVVRGLLSLAICKPMIRIKANVGDLIFGFAANSLRADNRLIYIAEVTDKSLDYYKMERFVKRADCIYEWKDGKYRRREHAKFHERPEDIIHDLGKGYERAQVLLSTKFRYFGSNGTDEYKRTFPRIMQAVKKLGRGFRVQLDEDLRKDLLRLKADQWKSVPNKVAGYPTEAPSPRACHRSKSCGVL